MTPLKQQISLIPFSIEYWYSPYKRRRFENRWDQTFCILLIEDVLSYRVQTSADAKIWNKSDPDSNFRINLDPDVRRISVSKLWIHSSASFILPSLVEIGCWFVWELRKKEMLINVGKSPISQWWRKWKTGIYAKIRITTKSQPLLEGHLLPVPAKIGRRPFPRSSVILFTEWQTE